MLAVSRSFRAVRVASRGLATHASTAPPTPKTVTRHDWTKQEIQSIYDSPLLDLVFRAAAVHREHNDPRKVQLCTLMNIKSAFPQPMWHPMVLTSC